CVLGLVSGRCKGLFACDGEKGGGRPKRPRHSRWKGLKREESRPRSCVAPVLHIEAWGREGASQERCRHVAWSRRKITCNEERARSRPPRRKRVEPPQYVYRLGGRGPDRGRRGRSPPRRRHA